MADEPIKRNWSEGDYQKCLDDMAPFLKLGHTLNSAIDDAGIVQHKTEVYTKYRLNDWFAQKVDNYRATPGILANDILTKVLMDVNDRIKQGRPVTEDDMKNVRFMAEKHRTAQPYFVTRTETAEADPSKVGKILDTIETDYGNLGLEASKQMVETNTPVQDKEQTGAVGDIPAELPTA
jgi:hypothetical protein